MWVRAKKKPEIPYAPIGKGKLCALGHSKSRGLHRPGGNRRRQLRDQKLTTPK